MSAKKQIVRTTLGKVYAGAVGVEHKTGRLALLVENDSIYSVWDVVVDGVTIGTAQAVQSVKASRANPCSRWRLARLRKIGTDITPPPRAYNTIVALSNLEIHDRNPRW